MDILNRISEKQLLYTGSAIMLLSVFTAVLANEPLLCLAPIAFLLACQLIIDFRPVFFLLLLVTPVAMEYHFDSGFSTDLPTEPLEITLMFTFIFYVLLRRENIDQRFLTHPVTILLFIHLAWIMLAVIYSQDIFVSFKYLLAKIWYIAVFYFVGGHIMRDPKAIKTFFWCLFIPTVAVVINTLIKHSQYGFAFSEVNKSMWPIFRNHVNYAVYLALFLPFLFLASSWYERFSWQRLLINLGKILVAAAIYFSYTRSAWLSVAAAIICYLLIRWNVLMAGVSLAIVGAIIFVVFMLHNNTYLKYAPDYKKTIYHTNFSEHMEATTSLEDVSSAERIHRWIAGVKMIEDKPFIGFGPSQFEDNYQPYAVNKFTTYISRNEEQSTIHNYYLMVTVEQGFPGLAIWMIFIVVILFYGQRAYTRAAKEEKPALMAIVLSLITILVNISLSDLIEADKIGTLFFLLIAMIVVADLQQQKTTPEKK
jgi:O-antigen ligase